MKMMYLPTDERSIVDWKRKAKPTQASGIARIAHEHIFAATLEDVSDILTQKAILVTFPHFRRSRSSTVHIDLFSNL
jgi:hypothetical protein